ncbi:MAG TPA: tetratricopeptide repeat protein, partial [Bryobacteraceae bacterium]
VSVMDFGIARSADASNMTRTGALLGTPTYMAPEQAQGQKIDARCDLYTLGIIFYELLTGAPPFEADNPMATLIKRIQEKAVPPAQVEPSVPKALNDMVLRMLAIAPAERYQSAADIIAELEQWEAERTGRTAYPGMITKATQRGRELPLKIVAVTMAVLCAVVAYLYFHLKHQAATPVAPEKSVTVLVSDFQNATGDSVFDGTLEPTFGLALEGASFISAYSRADAHRLAQQLQPGASNMDEKLARLVATRQGISVVVAGSIQSGGGGYNITVKALDTATGNPLAEKNARASGKQEVLAAVGKLAAPIRKALGDSTPESAQALAAETYSSSSLDAAQAYAKAQDLNLTGQFDGAVKQYEQAVALDPNMGRAYAGLAVAYANQGQRQEAEKYFEQATQRMDRMTERERYRTRIAYYLAVRNDQKAIEEASKLIKQYPADDSGLSNLALAYFYTRDIPRAIQEGRAAVQINPKIPVYRNNVALYEMYGGQFDDAIRDAAGVLKLDANYRKAYVAMALSYFAQGKMQEAADAYRGLERLNPRGASLASIGLADMALYEGREHDAISILEKGAAADSGAGYGSAAAIKLAALAAARRRGPAAIEAANRALAAGKQDGAAFAAARALLESGQEAKALKVAAEMGERLEPEPQAYAKLLTGEALLAKGKEAEAIQAFLEGQKLANTWLGRLDLARAYVEAGKFIEASSELDECLKRKGEATAVFLDDVPTYRYFPPVYYYRARAQEGLKSAGAAESYRTFLSIKAQSAPGDPMVEDARRRAAGLH